MNFSEIPVDNLKELGNHRLKAGWCRTDDLKQHSYLHPDFDRDLKFAISLVFPLSNEIIDAIDDKPTSLYQHHYRTVNAYLDREALILSNSIQNAGFRALPVPVTVSVDEFHGHLSNRMVGMLSGLGWIGKSALLVIPEFGARVRLVTILTDLPLPLPQEWMESRCGDCRECIDICPVKAIGDDPKAFNRQLCYKYLKSLIKHGIVEELICGLCVKACRKGVYLR